MKNPWLIVAVAFMMGGPNSSCSDATMYQDKDSSREDIDSAEEVDTGTVDYDSTGGNCDTDGPEPNEDAASIAQAITDLKPGCWYEIPNTKLEDSWHDWSGGIDPKSTAYMPTCNGLGNMHVMNGWSGGTFDTTGNRLLINGGGHGGYGGNEIYGFDFDTFSWSEVAPPSTYETIMNSVTCADEVDYYTDGRPSSRHSYNSLVYWPAGNAMCALGHAAPFANGQQRYPHRDCYDFDDNQWTTITPLPHANKSATALDSEGDIWILGRESERKLYEYDALNGTWEVRYPNQIGEGWPVYAITAVDTANDILVSVGIGHYFAFDISSYDANGYVKLISSTSTGDQTIVNSEHPTLAYDTVSDKLLGWSGHGSTVYALDTTTHQWTAVNAAPGNVVEPTDEAQWGTYGRWQYVPDLNVFCVVNRTSENVYVYRYSNDS